MSVRRVTNSPASWSSRKAFDLETPVVEYLQLNGTTFSPDINPYHLLTHTSGIAEDAAEEADERYEDLFVDLPNHSVRNFVAA